MPCPHPEQPMVVTLNGRASTNQSRPCGRHSPVHLAFIGLFSPHSGVWSQSLWCPPLHTPGTAWKYAEVTVVYRTNNCWNGRSFKTEGRGEVQTVGKIQEGWSLRGLPPFPSSLPSALSFLWCWTQRASTLSGTYHKNFSLRDNGIES